MHSSNRTYTITEYGGFTRGASADGYQGLPERLFDALEAFLLANTSGAEADPIELLSLSARRGIGKMITARNYVGLITMADGTVIEILPKIAAGQVSDADARQVFLEMLRTLKDAPFKESNVSQLQADRLSLLEIFIKMFLDEISVLTKQGLRSAYTPVERNERFYKGKLLAPQNIKHNLVHRERFFVHYDDFNLDRPENRLLKSTLRVLLDQTGDSRNRQSAAQLLTFFDGVQYSASYDADFSKCAADRNMSHYARALAWCRVFLHGKSFTAFAGSQVALALLFPMEKVFESYVAAKLLHVVPPHVLLRIQDSRYSLFDRPSKAFSLRPDVVLSIDGRTVVMDTKWKLLSGNVRNYGISQSDMYQMYAYAKKYDAEKVILLYPQLENLQGSDLEFCSDDGVNVKIAFIDLFHPEASLEPLI